jgi:4-deoxy-L-threo-5-hexosulose-uronate ketol-isomerase
MRGTLKERPHADKLQMRRAGNMHGRMNTPLIRQMPRASEASSLSPAALREAFVVENLMRAGELVLQFTDLDRLVAGGAVPMLPLRLPESRLTGTSFFLERRELGAINIGGAGVVTVDGVAHAVGTREAVYVGRGSREVEFASVNADEPAAFFILSCPAHATLPTRVMTQQEAAPVTLGAPETANRRTIYKYIHAAGIPSCQLVMGFTELAEGSVWNTMPPHTHTRRSEVYFYFDLGERAVAHFMGEPQATRHLWMQDRTAVLSPAWSIHCGCGTGAYRFIWGMAGENQTFDDMDPAPLAGLR